MIHTSRNLRQVLNYNEKKVQRNVAELIHAENFFGDKNKMPFSEKINRFKNLNELNTRSKVNTLHVSVNFHPDEKIDQQAMISIANEYMQRIGFGDQPYLVYQHHDSGHPHIHIVSSFIKANGKKIPVRNIGTDKSVKACRELEKEFNLTIAAKQDRRIQHHLQPIDIRKIMYGKSETKNAMQNILIHVIDEYRYTSIAELNAILNQYNMKADRGGEQSNLYQRNGLLYRVIDVKGKPVGVPIKASDFYLKPTLKNLEKKFEQNKEARRKYIQDIKTRIDWTLLGNPKDIEQFRNNLKNENIQLVVRQNDQGVIYGLTYLDFKTKTVLNGSDLGKDYSVKGMLVRFNQTDSIGKSTSIENEKTDSLNRSDDRVNEFGRERPTPEFSTALPRQIQLPELITDLLSVEKQFDQQPYELKKKKKKRRK